MPAISRQFPESKLVNPCNLSSVIMWRGSRDTKYSRMNNVSTKRNSLSNKILHDIQSDKMWELVYRWLSQYYNISKTTFLSTFQDKSDNKIESIFFFFFFFIQRQSVRLHTVWSICQSHMVYLDAISIMFCNQNWVQKKGKKWPHKDKEALTVHSQWACSHSNDSETRTNDWSLHQKSGFQQLTVVQDLMCAQNAIKKNVSCIVEVNKVQDLEGKWQCKQNKKLDHNFNSPMPSGF